MTNPPTQQGVTLREALQRLVTAVDWHLGKSGFTQSKRGRGFSFSEDVRKELYAAHDAAEAALSHPPALEQPSGEQSTLTPEQINEVNNSLWAELDEIKDKTGYNEYHEANRGLGHWTLLGYLLNLKHKAATHTAEPAGEAVACSCAECGKTSTKDSMWALYCVDCAQKHGIGAMPWIELVHELCPEGIEQFCDECGGEDSKCPGSCTYRKARAMLSASPAALEAAHGIGKDKA